MKDVFELCISLSIDFQLLKVLDIPQSVHVRMHFHSKYFAPHFNNSISLRKLDKATY